MMRAPTVCLLAVVAWLAADLAQAEEQARWRLPVSPAEARLPKLTAALALDGELQEWGGIPSVPIRNQNFLAHRQPAHEWRGPSDLSAEFFCAWRENGLCLAARVHDDDLVNEREPALLWQQDCIELFVDCRTGDRFLRPPYSAGACQIFIRPPLPGKAVLTAVNPRDGALSGLQAAGKTIAGGYQVEIFLPWTAFPDFKPTVGASLGLQFAVDDYDRRDGALSQPLVMSWQGATSLFNSPQKLMRWTLVEKLEWRADSPLAAHWAIDVETNITGGDAAAIVFKGAQVWPFAVNALKAKVLNWRGEVVQEGEIPLQPAEPPWQPALQGNWRWSFREQPDGVYAIELAVEGEAGCLGKAQRHVMLAAGTMSAAQQAVAKAVAAIKDIDLSSLVEHAPWRAKAWLGLAANVEKVKWAAEIRDFHLLRLGTDELAGRLAILTAGALPPETSSAIRLLAIAGQPEAQIAVEYPARRNMPAGAPLQAAVNFYSGSLPLASCAVWEYSTEEEARAAANSSPWWGTTDVSEEVDIDGCPARLTTKKFEWLPYDLARFDPQQQIAVCSATNRRCLVLKCEDSEYAQAEALCLAKGVSDEIAARLQRWAEKKGVPLLPLAEAMKKNWFAVAGRWYEQPEVEPLRKAPCYLVAPRPGAAMLKICRGRLVFSSRAPSRAGAELALRLTMSGRPVSAAEVERLRQIAWDALPAAAREAKAKLPAAVRLWCGDVHTHSCYSDGSLTAAGMFLQGIYNQMDFMVLSDHNTLEGARMAAHLFAASGLRYAPIIGEEITTNWIHANAYPLKTVVAPTLSPAETVAAVHGQGAVIQWNHPGSYDVDWFKEHGETGLAGTGMDAWEHYPTHYQRWKHENCLPTLVGSSDTHSGTFEAGERTVIRAAQPDGDDLAEAVRRGRTALLSINEPEYAYGSDEMIALVAAALADGARQQEHTAARLREMLRQADVSTLLRLSPSRPITVDELEERKSSGE